MISEEQHDEIVAEIRDAEERKYVDLTERIAEVRRHWDELWIRHHERKTADEYDWIAVEQAIAACEE